MTAYPTGAWTAQRARNPVRERVIGTLRRELLDRVLAAFHRAGEQGMRPRRGRVLAEFLRGGRHV
ncbi:hypothetical protein [Nonomuraea sp. NPDC050643]|uniref:hypothetical protein n=1 Tax=Nonomuraea sp. NPDC050643 TaxID=3155660 RepID=UPI0033F33D61